MVTIYHLALPHPGLSLANYMIISVEKISLSLQIPLHRRAARVLGYGRQPPGCFSSEPWHAYCDNLSRRHSMARPPCREEDSLWIMEICRRQDCQSLLLILLDATASHL